MSSTYGSTQIPVQIKVIRTLFKTVGRVSPSLAGYLAFQLFSTPLKRNRKPMVHNPRQFTFTHKGRTLVAYEWDGSGPTILLVHGWESYAGRFKKLIGLLLEQGFRVIAMDAPAHGYSEGQQTNPLDYSEALYEFTKHTGEIHTIIAHSLGGAATMLLLGLNTDFSPEKVVLIGAVNHPHDGIYPFAKMMHLPDAARSKMQTCMEKYTGLSLDAVSGAVMAKNIQSQGLIIHDLDDNIISVESGRAIASAWDGANYHETTGLGHRRILQDKTVLERIVSFVGQEEQASNPVPVL